MPRDALSAAKLYALLDREFRKVRKPGCTSCLMPLPFYREPVDAFTANWHIGTPARCPRQCHLAVAEIVARLWTRYDLKVPKERRKTQRPNAIYDRPVQRGWP